MSVKIFAMTHKRFDVPDNPMYIPLHVGHAAAKEEFGYLGDDTGDNISDLNCYYAELSGVYWVWKNYHKADYVGICHYRRFLISETGYVFSEKEYEKILKEYDIITTKQLELPNSYHYGFGAHHKISTLDETGNIIKKIYPEYYDAFVTLVNQNKTYFGNIMVTKKELFDEYADWLFTIFFELQKRIDLTFEDDYHKRVFGFISEFLLLVWVTVRRLKAFECRVAIIGEKMETREIKDKMAVYFKNKDVDGAKKYFEQCLKSRPDVLMEASDITGECKICLQAVSTANLEIQEYKNCFLEKINEYQDIIQYFRQLNNIALELIKAAQEQNVKLSDASREWLNKNEISQVAIKAAIRIYATDRETAIRAYEICISDL